MTRNGGLSTGAVSNGGQWVAQKSTRTSQSMSVLLSVGLCCEPILPKGIRGNHETFQRKKSNLGRVPTLLSGDVPRSRVIRKQPRPTGQRRDDLRIMNTLLIFLVGLMTIFACIGAVAVILLIFSTLMGFWERSLCTRNAVLATLVCMASSYPIFWAIYYFGETTLLVFS